MTEAPPVFSAAPQFTPEHWSKVPRSTVKAVIERITHRGDYTEIALKGGAAFQRRRDEIQQLLTANQEVHIEHIAQGQLVTGLFVPNIGWAFRMTNGDLAEYTKRLSLAEHNRRRAVRERMIMHLAEALTTGLDELGFEDDENARIPRAALHLAHVALEALEQGPAEK